jgi:hypothetical protein
MSRYLQITLDISDVTEVREAEDIFSSTTFAGPGMEWEYDEHTREIHATITDTFYGGHYAEIPEKWAKEIFRVLGREVPVHIDLTYLERDPDISVDFGPAKGLTSS